MSLDYGFVKVKVMLVVKLKGLLYGSEIQYYVYLMLVLLVGDWDVVINVGINDVDDLLNYKFVYDFYYLVMQMFVVVVEGYIDLMVQIVLFVFDYLCSDILNEMGVWCVSVVMDGIEYLELILLLLWLVSVVQLQGFDVVVFGCIYV